MTPLRRRVIARDPHPTSTSAGCVAVGHQHDLLVRLERAARQAAADETIDAQTLLNSLGASTIIEKCFIPEHMQSIDTVGVRSADAGRVALSLGVNTVDLGAAACGSPA